jgi:hypothetical protein
MTLKQPLVLFQEGAEAVGVKLEQAVIAATASSSKGLRDGRPSAPKKIIDAADALTGRTHR